VSSTFRHLVVGFAIIAGGVMAANLLAHFVTPEVGLAYPGWVVLCLVPAYWYGHRIGVVSYCPSDILRTAAAVLIAVAVIELWSIVRPLSAVGLAALVCLFFFFRRRWFSRERGTGIDG
jgi:hypothetical protein